MRSWLDLHRVQVRLGTGVRSFQVSDERIEAVLLRDGETIVADWVISTVPFDRLLELLPTSEIDRHPEFAGIR
ncbi:FAD-dependent oxidoreductase, partial [Listeria monocytogenes]|uniref:FAD-dependent oxidoreductase n=1 Tax=Listeria monocytogenes TaxID=1639 RepID=UPI003FA45024